MKYKPERDLPEFAREFKTVQPSKLAQIILERRNVKRTPESITMWFRDHPDIYEALQKEIVEGLPSAKEVVDTTMYELGSFAEIQSVKNWVLYMRTRRRKGRPLHPDYIKDQVRLLRQALKEHSVLKHPDRLTFRDAQEIFLEAESKGKDTYSFRRALKDFLKSKGSPDWEKIGVGKPRGFGKYRDLYVEKEIIYSMLGFILSQDFEVYVIDKIMWHNGLRIGAVLNARINDVVDGKTLSFVMLPTGWAMITVKEKFQEIKTFRLVPEVAKLISEVIGERKTGKIFSANERRVNVLNRAAIKKYAPDLEPKVRMPSHFFRHMFFQHLLRLLGWNYDKAAAIGQTTAQSLKESYGGMPTGDVQEWEQAYLPQLDPDAR